MEATRGPLSGRAGHVGANGRLAASAAGGNAAFQRHLVQCLCELFTGVTLGGQALDRDAQSVKRFVISLS